MQEAEGRLPWLCPLWTDHNEHDPGITLLELMAWFKEGQQYEMNQITPTIERKLLELAGVRLGTERAAECALEIPPEAPPRAMLSRLLTPQGTAFELSEPIPKDRAILEKIAIKLPGGKGTADLTNLFSGGTPILPFAFGGEDGSALLLGFSRRGERKLRLWFDVAASAGVRRNAPDILTEPPRTLVWEMTGVGSVEPLKDETLALSWSGYVTLPVSEAWQPGEDGLYWLRISQSEPGCEERVHLGGVSAGRYRALQTESRARVYRFTVEGVPACEVTVDSAQAVHAEPAVFLREKTGWRQVSQFRFTRGKLGVAVELDTTGAAEDGGENLLIACLDPLHLHNLLLDLKGLPGESVQLNLEGCGVLTERLTLMCQTLYKDGKVRPAVWSCVEDLSNCGPRDHVFSYDRRRETITFGDGLNGAIPCAGSGAMLIVEEIVSLLSGGNIPAEAGLVFADDQEPVYNDAAWGGRDEETSAEGRGRLLRRLEDTRKCVSAADYEQRARETPGIRVAGAKALPGFNAHQRHQYIPACVSVAVLPESEEPKPAADERFLAAVSRQLERYRTICIRTEAIPVRYADFSVSIRIRGEAGFRLENVREAVSKFFVPKEARIGAPGSRDELAAALQKIPGVLQIDQIEFRGMDQGSYQTAAGDLTVPPDTVLSLRRADIVLTNDRR